jgi:hypothetical protein
MEDDVDVKDGIGLDTNVDMERHGDDDEEEDELLDDEKKDDEKEDRDENDGKEPRMIGQGEMVNTSTDNADAMRDHELTVLPELIQQMEQGQEMRKHTPRPKAVEPVRQPETPEPPPRTPNPETHTLSRPVLLRLMTAQNPRPAAQTLRKAEAARNTVDVNVERS